jgi:hypothetical protein
MFLSVLKTGLFEHVFNEVQMKGEGFNESKKSDYTRSRAGNPVPAGNQSDAQGDAANRR